MQMDLWYDPEQQVIIDKNERRKHYSYTFWFAPFIYWISLGPVKILRIRR